MNPSILITPNGVKAGKLYSIKPTDGSGDLDVVRATTATRVNSDGLIESVGVNVPRLDYSNGSCPSILVEPQRTNLFLRSEEFDNASWLKASGTFVTPNVSIAPNGTLTADLIFGTNLNISQNISVGIGTYTFSVYLKSEGTNIGKNVGIRFQNTPFPQTNITTDGTWQRVSVTITTTTSVTLNPRILTFGTTNPVSEILVWGAQLEAGANATSYIPTVGSTVTRNADVISKTGISSLINSQEGCFFVDFLDMNISDNQFKEFSLSDGTINNIIRLGYFTNAGANFTISCNVILSNVTQFTFSQSFIKGVRNKILLRYKQGEFSLFRNGVLLTQQNSGNIFDSNILSQFHYSRNNQAAFFVGNVNSNLLLPYLTNQQCIDLTTL